MELYRKLNKEEEKEFRQWARENFIPSTMDIKAVWHPIVKDECLRMCCEPEKIVMECPNCEERKKLFPEDILMELVLGYVNDVRDHRIDEKRLAGQISNIISEIEELAVEVENGEYEEPEQEPYECSMCHKNSCSC